jgi:hypothetical protein
VVLTDMDNLPCRWLISVNYEVCFVFSYTNIHGIDSIKFMQGGITARTKEQS